uniref:Uncharacterized protein n=1 Tax=Onchocerca volvulus TaxID=6282 RepID=A0A8R1Y1K3_ONCVO
MVMVGDFISLMVSSREIAVVGDIIRPSNISSRSRGFQDGPLTIYLLTLYFLRDILLSSNRRPTTTAQPTDGILVPLCVSLSCFACLDLIVLSPHTTRRLLSVHLATMWCMFLPPCTFCRPLYPSFLPRPFLSFLKAALCLNVAASKVIGEIRTLFTAYNGSINQFGSVQTFEI